MITLVNRLLDRAGLQLTRKEKPPAVQAGKGSRIHPSAEIRGFAENVKLGNNVYVDAHAVIECRDRETTVEIGDNSVVKSSAMILAYGNAKVRIGSFCGVNPFTVLYGLGDLNIGNYVRIATHCVVIPANHIFDDPDVPITGQGLTKLGIVIEDDVWVGAGARILDGCVIGKGSVIGAGTVLTKSVAPWSIVVGVPGRVVGSRRK